MNELAAMNVKEMTPAQLGGEIRLLTQQARRMALSYGIQIGYRLHVAHEKVGPHGWAEWLKQETEFSAAAASRFESLYEGYGEDQGNIFGVGNKFPTLENLSISNALRLLAIPEEEREDVAKEVDAEHLSARELDKALKERDEALKEKEELQERVTQAELTEKDLRGQIRDLESRPQPVAVERDESAIEQAEAVAEAKATAEWGEKVQKLEAELEKAKANADKLKAKVDKADASAEEKISAAEKETERLRQELEAARKKLQLSDADVTAFGIHFNAGQKELQAALGDLEKIAQRDPATAVKLCAAFRQLETMLTARVNEVEQKASAGEAEMGGADDGSRLI